MHLGIIADRGSYEVSVPHAAHIYTNGSASSMHIREHCLVDPASTAESLLGLWGLVYARCRVGSKKRPRCMSEVNVVRLNQRFMGGFDKDSVSY